MTFFEPVLRHPLERLIRSPAPRGRGRPRTVQPLGPRGVPFLAVREGQCRFPLWGEAVPSADALMCCGAATDGEAPYCKAHRARCWRGQGAEIEAVE